MDVFLRYLTHLTELPARSGADIRREPVQRGPVQDAAAVGDGHGRRRGGRDAPEVRSAHRGPQQLRAGAGERPVRRRYGSAARGDASRNQTCKRFTIFQSSQSRLICKNERFNHDSIKKSSF